MTRCMYTVKLECTNGWCFVQHCV